MEPFPAALGPFPSRPSLAIGTGEIADQGHKWGQSKITLTDGKVSTDYARIFTLTPFMIYFT
jgi:hypothetical protein